MMRRCIICGAEFSAPPSNNKRTCSPACSSQWRSKQHMGVSNRWSEGAKAAARAAAAKTGNLKNGMAAAMNLPERISIHAPLAGCDRIKSPYGYSTCAFQSTHPLRGATLRQRHRRRQRQHFNPRTPCGVRRSGAGSRPAGRDFNPRTPCGVRRLSGELAQVDRLLFQSTHPLRGATFGLIAVRR